MKLHYMLEPPESVCGKPCKQLEEIPTDLDIQRTDVMGKLTRCKKCIAWYEQPTSEKTSVYLGEEVKPTKEQ